MVRLIPERHALHRMIVKDFRPRLVLGHVAFICAAGAAFIAVIFGPLIFRSFDASLPPREQDAIATALLVLHSRIWPGVAAVVVIGLLHLRFVSRRAAGPLARLDRIFHAVRRGDVSMRIRVRERDYLREDAAILDGMITGLRRKLGTAKCRAQRLEAAVDDLQLALCTGTKGEVDLALESVRVRARQLRERLDTFRTVPSPRAPQPEPAGAATDAGYTLLELIVAVVIVVTLAAISIPLYGKAVDNAKVVRAATEIRAIAADIRTWSITKGRLPENLVEAGIGDARDPYGTPYQYLPIDGHPSSKAAARTDGAGEPINGDFDLYSAGSNRTSNHRINHRESLDDIVLAFDGGFVGLASAFPATGRSTGTGDHGGAP